MLQCTAPEQNFGIVSTVAEVLRSKITAPEQIFGMVSSVCVAIIVLHFTALELKTNYFGMMLTIANCSGVKFRNSVSDFSSGAVHCNTTATPRRFGMDSI